MPYGISINYFTQLIEKPMKRFCSLVLAALILLSVFPMSVFAASVEDSLSAVNFTVIDKDQSTLAPGVTMDELVVYNNSNQRVEMYVTKKLSL